MKKMLNIDGKRVKALVNASELTREKFVVLVQDKGFQFSTSGLDKIFRNELPRKDTEEILGIIASACRCNISDFAELETRSA